jgi:hypothetical protein
MDRGEIEMAMIGFLAEQIGGVASIEQSQRSSVTRLRRHAADANHSVGRP